MDKFALTRVIIFVLAWVNSLLVSKGLQPLPVLDEMVISSIITFIVSVWVLVRDNKLKKPVDKTRK